MDPRDILIALYLLITFGGLLIVAGCLIWERVTRGDELPRYLSRER